MEEFVFLGLRRMEGISISEFERTFGERLEQIWEKTLKKWSGAGCLAKKGGFWFLTEKGIDISNVVLADFLSDTA